MSKSLAKRDKLRARRQQKRKALRAAAEADGPLWFEADGEVEIVAAGEGDSGEDSPPAFSMVAYSGGKMRPRGFPHPVVANLGGMKTYSGATPIHVYHDQKRPVAHGEASIGKSVRVEGVMSVPGADLDMVRASSHAGFPWKASVGLTLDDELQFYAAGESFQANNRTFRGPCYYASKSTLFEVSFVTVAGDPTTRTAVASHYAGDPPMTGFENWLEANGWDAADLSDNQTTMLQAMYDQEQGGSPQQPSAAGGTATLEASARDQISDFMEQKLQSMNEQFAQRLEAQARISELQAEYGQQQIEVEGKKVDLYAHAARTGMDLRDVELHALRNRRSTSPQVQVEASGPPAEDVIVAAACREGRAFNDDDALIAAFGEETMNRAEDLRDLGLQELCAMACDLEGVERPRRMRGDGLRRTLKAAFSTKTLPSLFENVLNKSLLPILEGFPMIATELCDVGPASDFKQINEVRLLGTGRWERVGASGDLSSGQISDEKFTRQVESFGEYVGLTWQDFKNDDLRALNAISQYMAIMGREVVDWEFAKRFNQTAGFFTSGNGNLATGAPFGLESLSATKTLFRKMKAGPGLRDKNKRSINVRPEHLVVPVEIEDEVASFLGSPNLIAMDRDTTATAGSKTGPKNPHFGQYRVHSHPYFSDADAGGSATAFTMLANPRLVAAYALSFLDGVQNPIIEAGEPEFTKLGYSFRGHIHFGVDRQDPRGAVRNPGVAA